MAELAVFSGDDFYDSFVSVDINVSFTDIVHFPLYKECISPMPIAAFNDRKWIKGFIHMDASALTTELRADDCSDEIKHIQIRLSNNL